MKINSEIKTCVAFVGHKKNDTEFTFAGTALLGMGLQSEFRGYIITAKHVINGIKSLGLNDVYIKVNLENGISEWLMTDLYAWILHEDPNVDVAIYKLTFAPEIIAEPKWDHRFYSLLSDTILTKEIIDQYRINVGDELFIVGLFHHHHGKKRNIPIIRTGILSALNEEKIQTTHHLMEGYLIEAQSIGGLSGSPVFINIDSMRAMPYANVIPTAPPQYFLAGIIYGHFDEKPYGNSLNTGIAIVTPVQKILELVSANP